jgi:hypothetical protein
MAGQCFVKFVGIEFHEDQLRRSQVVICERTHGQKVFNVPSGWMQRSSKIQTVMDEGKWHIVLSFILYTTKYMVVGCEEIAECSTHIKNKNV